MSIRHKKVTPRSIEVRQGMRRLLRATDGDFIVQIIGPIESTLILNPRRRTRRARLELHAASAFFTDGPFAETKELAFG